jgi:hypothetical protein
MDRAVAPDDGTKGGRVALGTLLHFLVVPGTVLGCTLFFAWLDWFTHYLNVAAFVVGAWVVLFRWLRKQMAAVEQLASAGQIRETDRNLHRCAWAFLAIPFAVLAVIPIQMLGSWLFPSTRQEKLLTIALVVMLLIYHLGFGAFCLCVRWKMPAVSSEQHESRHR